MKTDSIKNVLFDLDGTLTDPVEGITRSLQYALCELGVACPAPAELHIYIGPPIRDALAILLKTTDQSLVEEALRLYRVRFSETGIYENEVYDGVPEMLADLRASSHRLFVATAKPLVFTEKIMKHFRLSNYFEGIYGSELNGKLDNKVELIRHILKNAELSPGETLMVGDRMYDIRGARENGCMSLGVIYGYGSEEELKSAGADLICDSPQEIATRLCAPG
ncbi:MAG: phosphoglycolate phosphatase [Acidobacteriota bacterium]|jgi:phosphoglycolate phosphatase|nr:phosphoglycolate phosphatase [Acidobacteriota bacterium]